MSGLSLSLSLSRGDCGACSGERYCRHFLFHTLERIVPFAGHLKRDRRSHRRKGTSHTCEQVASASETASTGPQRAWNWHGSPSHPQATLETSGATAHEQLSITLPLDSSLALNASPCNSTSRRPGSSQQQQPGSHGRRVELASAAKALERRLEKALSEEPVLASQRSHRKYRFAIFRWVFFESGSKRLVSLWLCGLFLERVLGNTTGHVCSEVRWNDRSYTRAGLFFETYRRYESQKRDSQSTAQLATPPRGSKAEHCAELLEQDAAADARVRAVRLQRGRQRGRRNSEQRGLRVAFERGAAVFKI